MIAGATAFSSHHLRKERGCLVALALHQICISIMVIANYF